jgi:hypothetical protein
MFLFFALQATISDLRNLLFHRQLVIPKITICTKVAQEQESICTTKSHTLFPCSEVNDSAAGNSKLNAGELGRCTVLQETKMQISRLKDGEPTVENKANLKKILKTRNEFEHQRNCATDKHFHADVEISRYWRHKRPGFPSGMYVFNFLNKVS